GRRRMRLRGFVLLPLFRAALFPAQEPQPGPLVSGGADNLTWRHPRDQARTMSGARRPTAHRITLPRVAQALPRANHASTPKALAPGLAGLRTPTGRTPMSPPPYP